MLNDDEVEYLREQFKLPSTLSNEEIKNLTKDLRKPYYNWWVRVILFVFAWVSLGTTVIIGLRLFFNSPIHPSFALYGVVTYSAAIAFAIVLTFDVVTGGNLNFEFAGQKFNGTSGPVTLWVLAFLAIMAAFIATGFNDLAKSPMTARPSLDQCFRIDCTKSVTPVNDQYAPVRK
jgi:hypothetical protein